MATGRTISANFLTDLDKQVLNLCKDISLCIYNNISAQEAKKNFWDKFGKVSNSRDAGAGVGGGKIQRDSLCTRGRQGKAPYSNRNLRWHPLVISAQNISFATPIERIEIEGDDSAKTLIFVVKINNEEEKFPSDKVHELPKRFVALPEHWVPHVEKLKYWNDTLWTQNSCIITSMEACEWWNAVEIFAFLSISVAVEYYNVDFTDIYFKIINTLNSQRVDQNIQIPSPNFPSSKEDFIKCPVCKRPLSDNLENFRQTQREKTWQPAWKSSKRSEGEDGSNQILHILPLVETEIRHKVGQVKFGHRWCNVAMSDHSLEETLDFFEYIINAHGRI